MKKNSFLSEIGLIFSTTLGAGFFALPFVFLKAGWVLGLIYLLFFSVLITAVHVLYFRVLTETSNGKRLLGLIKEKLGRRSFGVAIFTVLGGLTLALTAYLILGSRFLELIFPSLGFGWALIIFWILGSAPLFLSLKKIIGVELLGGLMMVGIIVYVFLSEWPLEAIRSIPVLSLENIFLPFGVILFSLAGWTAIEPIYENYRGRSTGISFKNRIFQFGLGTFASALVYLFFVLAILSGAKEVTPDTVSGLGNWPDLKIKILGALGILALLTSYWPIAREIENLTVKDLKWKKTLSWMLVIFVPLFLVVLGFRNFLTAVSLVGGVFLATQYFFLVRLGIKTLRVQGFKKFGLYLAGLIFVLGAIYEIYYFILK